MKILVLSQYYSPELAPSSFRMDSLVKHIKSKLGNNAELNIITTMPSRYANEKMSASTFEQHENVTIERISVPSINTSMISQIKSYIYFCFAVLKLTRNRDYDLVFGTSSRLMTAVLSVYISRRKAIPVYLDIRDILADGIQEILPKYVGFITKIALSLIERWSFRNADKINLISQGFEPYFKKRFSNKEYSYFTNGIDQIILQEDFSPSNKEHDFNNIPIILYAGNLGDGQAVHKIIPELALRLEGHFNFLIIGNGKYRKKLQLTIQERGISNVTIMERISRQRLLQKYKEVDILFLHLNDHEAFEKVLPSKIFEYAATGKPIVGGLAGYAKNFVESNVANAEVFTPLNVDEAIKALKQIDLRWRDRSSFKQQFARDAIMSKMADDVIELANKAKKH